MTEIEARILGKRGKQRSGRGFSKNELKQVNLTIKDALRHKIPTDAKRGTAHEQNVQTLKTFLETHKAQSKPKKKSKS